MKRLLFIGDVVGEAGCDFLRAKLSLIKRTHNIDITVVNGENSARGNGISKASAEAILNAGADVITTGNHAFRRKETLDIFNSDNVIRPANYPDGGVVGKGVYILDAGMYSAAFVNIMGTAFMEPLDNPFACMDEILAEIETPNIFVDFHAEATSEKKAMGFYLAGKVTGVFGTHTHVQTADECILSAHTAYITDVGMTGPEDSCLGVEKDPVINMFRYRAPARFTEASGPCLLCGIVVDFDEKCGKSHKIERIIVR
ncbi:MAG: TIGR00282 family metallophosphoesterase [Ruminococcus flavefaciens]|jgi:hypothetical protein|nr:TIGR00282 family metallophosphoesterase [Ruminococcus flavefaciens]